MSCCCYNYNNNNNNNNNIKYINLAEEIKRIWNQTNVFTIPVVLSSTGIISKKNPPISEKAKPATKSIPRATKSLYITVVVFAIRSGTCLKPYLLPPTKRRVNK
jgi:hypothetical protein